MIDIITGTDGTERLTGTESKKGGVIAASVVLVCLALAAAGSAYWIKAHNKPIGAPDPAAAEAAVRAADAQWSSVAGKLDVNGTIAFYSDDAVVLPPNQPMVHNKLDEQKVWAALLVPGTDVSWTAGRVEAAPSADVVYDVGVYTIITKATKGHPQTTDGGKYLEVWKKQADGSWKCVADSWSSDKAAPVAKK